MSSSHWVGRAGARSGLAARATACLKTFASPEEREREKKQRERKTKKLIAAQESGYVTRTVRQRETVSETGKLEREKKKRIFSSTYVKRRSGNNVTSCARVCFSSKLLDESDACADVESGRHNVLNANERRRPAAVGAVEAAAVSGARRPLAFRGGRVQPAAGNKNNNAFPPRPIGRYDAGRVGETSSCRVCVCVRVYSYFYFRIEIQARERSTSDSLRTTPMRGKRGKKKKRKFLENAPEDVIAGRLVKREPADVAGAVLCAYGFGLAFWDGALQAATRSNEVKSNKRSIGWI